MSPLNQNLFLFFEENEMSFVIDLKLVKLYTNRCIIDEDAKFEIAGVYELQKVTEPMLYHLNPLFKTNASQRTNKEAVDRDIFTDAIEEACALETDSTDNHFIIGSSFHSQFVEKASAMNPIEKLLDWLLNEVKSQELKNLYVTFVLGSRGSLITKEMHINVHKNEIPCHQYKVLPGVWDEPQAEVLS